MSAKQRTAALLRAIEAGKQAREEGKPRTDNPYKRGGEWSLWHPWDIGWCGTQAEEDSAPGVSPSDQQSGCRKDADGSPTHQEGQG